MIHFKIKKPLYGNFVNLRKSLLLRAIKDGELIKITIPQGSAIVSPVWWIKTGKEVEQVFKIPDRPMKLVGNYVEIKPKQTEDEKAEEFCKNYL
jgi:hypothetical protein